VHIPGGVIRVDRSRLAFEHELTMGHFGMPHLNGVKAQVSQYEEGNKRLSPHLFPAESSHLFLIMVGMK